MCVYHRASILRASAAEGAHAEHHPPRSTRTPLSSAERGATRKACHDRNVVGFRDENGVAGTGERLGLNSSDLIRRKDLQIEGVGHICEG